MILPNNVSELNCAAVHKAQAVLFNAVAGPQPNLLRVVERRHDFSVQNQGEPFDAFKVGVFNRRHTGVAKEMLGVVVDQLPVDEYAKGNDRQLTAIRYGSPARTTDLMSCLSILSTFCFIFAFSAFSISATLSIESTRTRAP